MFLHEAQCVVYVGVMYFVRQIKRDVIHNGSFVHVMFINAHVFCTLPLYIIYGWIAM